MLSVARTPGQPKGLAPMRILSTRGGRFVIHLLILLAKCSSGSHSLMAFPWVAFFAVDLSKVSSMFLCESLCQQRCGQLTETGSKTEPVEYVQFSRAYSKD